MSNRTIEAVLKLSAKLGNLRALSTLQRELKKVDQQSRAFGRTQATMAKTSTAAYSAMARYVAPAVLAYGAKQAMVDAATSERRLNRIAVTAGEGKAALAEMRSAIDRTALEYAMSQNDVVSGLEELIAAGREAKDAMTFLPAVTATAQASGADVRDIATTADAVANSFEIAGDKMQGAFDILVEGGKAGKFELKDMAQYLPSLAPAFQTLGYKGEAGLGKLVAILQTVRMRTGSASEAATAAANIFQKMESDATVKKFKNFGVDLRTELERARKEGKDLIDVFMDLTEKATKGDYSKITQLFTDAQFQVGMRALMQGRADMEGFANALKDADGSTLKDLGQILSDSQTKIDRLGASWDKFKISLGSSINDLGITDVLNSVANEADYAMGVNRGLELSGVHGFWERTKWGLTHGREAKDAMAWKGGIRSDEDRRLIKVYGEFGQGRKDEPQREVTFETGRDDAGVPVPVPASGETGFDADWKRQALEGVARSVGDALAIAAMDQQVDHPRQELARMFSDGGATYEARLASGYYGQQTKIEESIATVVSALEKVRPADVAKADPKIAFREAEEASMSDYRRNRIALANEIEATRRPGAGDEATIATLSRDPKQDLLATMAAYQHDKIVVDSQAGAVRPSPAGPQPTAGAPHVDGAITSIAEAIAKIDASGRDAGDAVKAGGDAAGQTIEAGGNSAASLIEQSGSAFASSVESSAARLENAIAGLAAAAAKLSNININVNQKSSGQPVNFNPGRSMPDAGRAGGPD